MPARRHMFPLRLSGYFFFDFPFSTSSFLIPFSGLSFSLFLADFVYVVFLILFLIYFSYLLFLSISLICFPLFALLLQSSSLILFPTLLFFFSILLYYSIMQFFPAVLYIKPSPCLPILIFYAHILLFQVLKKILNIY